MAEHASQLYARNIESLLGLMISEEGALSLDFDDEVIAGACITRDGEIVHEARQGGRRAAGRELVSRRPVSTITEIAILVLAAFVGFEVISKVPEHAAHAADVGHERDPRDRAARRSAADAARPAAILEHVTARDRDRVRHDQRRRRLPGHRPDARDVQAQARPAPKEPAEVRGRRGRDRSPRSSCRARTSSTRCYIVAFSLFIYGMSGLTGACSMVYGFVTTNVPSFVNYARCSAR